MVTEGYFRRNQRLLNGIQILLDALVICASLFITYGIHHNNFLHIPTPYFLLMILAAVFFYITAISTKLYGSWRSDQLTRHIARVFQIWVFTMIGLILLGWALKTTEYYSRVVMALWFTITPLFLGLTRWCVRAVLGYIRSQGRNTRQIALVGDSQAALELVKELRSNEWMGYILAGYYNGKQSDTLENIEYKGDYEQLINDVKQNKYDEVYLALPMTQESLIAELIHSLSDCSTPVHILPDLFIFSLMNARMSRIGNVPTISVFDSPHDDLSAILKRIEDVLLSSIILLLISPVMLILAIAIKTTSKGPVFFKQRRYGIGGEEIIVWKFRSMSVCEDGDDVPQATKNDVRITPLGNFMRRTSLDELPQFINVLQGQMSIVGPRPHAVAHNELYRKDIHGYMLRHLVKPGITGWAQVNGWRGETDTLNKMEKRVEHDMEYIRNWSIIFDLKIIAMTIVKGFSNKNAY